MKTQTPDEPTSQVPLTTSSPPYTTVDNGAAGYLYALGFHELGIDRSANGDIVFTFPSEVHDAAAASALFNLPKSSFSPPHSRCL
jgi:hypothetical protein